MQQPLSLHVQLREQVGELFGFTHFDSALQLPQRVM